MANLGHSSFLQFGILQSLELKNQVNPCFPLAGLATPPKMPHLSLASQQHPAFLVTAPWKAGLNLQSPRSYKLECNLSPGTTAQGHGSSRVWWDANEIPVTPTGDFPQVKRTVQVSFCKTSRYSNLSHRSLFCSHSL